MRIVKTISLGIVATLTVLVILGICALTGLSSTAEVIDGGSKLLGIIALLTLWFAAIQGISRLNRS